MISESKQTPDIAEQQSSLNFSQPKWQSTNQLNNSVVNANPLQVLDQQSKNLMQASMQMMSNNSGTSSHLQLTPMQSQN